MDRSKIVRLLWVSVPTLCGSALTVVTGCGSAAPESQDVGVATVALSERPSDVSCLEIAAAGTRQVVKRFSVAPGPTPTFEVSGLPLGDVQFTALAFKDACNSVPQGPTPTWISEPVLATIAKHVVAQVRLVMRRNGHASVGVDFRDCVAGFVDLGTLDGTASINPVDMNNQGQIIGTTATEPFLWSGGTMRALGTGPGSAVAAINDKGQVAGWNERGVFLWEDGATYEMGTLGGSGSSAQAINEAGQVVGGSATATGEYHAFSWQRGSAPIDLGSQDGWSVARAINASGQIVGEGQSPTSYPHALLWQAGTMRDLGTLGGVMSGAVAINDAGQVIGSSYNADGDEHAFLWEGGVMRDLGTLGGTFSYAVAINSRGQVVGWSTLTREGGEDHAFLWDAGTMRDLGALGGFLSAPFGRRSLNDVGEVVGQAETGPGEIHGFLWQSGALHDLGTFGVPYTVALGINAAHQIFGLTATSSGRQRGFFFDVGTCAFNAMRGGGQ